MKTDYVKELMGQALTGVGAQFIANYADNDHRVQYAENYRALAEMARSRFEWTGLPDTVSSRYIEKALFEYGTVVFFRDSPETTNAFFALRGNGYGRKNMYDEFTRFQITAPNFKSKRVTTDEAVPVYSNASRVSDTTLCALYADRLTELDVTFDVNAEQVRRTRIIVSDANERLTDENINDAVRRGDPFVTLARDLDPRKFAAFDMGVEPKNLIDLHIARQRIWADIMTRLGIDNANQDKKERLVSDEVDSNNAQIGALRQSPLDERKEAVKLIKRRWPDEFADLDVRYRQMTVDVGSEATMQGAARSEGVGEA